MDRVIMFNRLNYIFVVLYFMILIIIYIKLIIKVNNNLELNCLMII